MAIYFESEINRRSKNEDSFCSMEFRMNHEAAVNAMAVADGMGGLSGGKLYSETAIRLWYEALLKRVMGDAFRDCSLQQQIETLVTFSETIPEEINRQLYKKGLDVGMKGGTTLSAAIHFWDTWIISNCGDSPVYCMDQGRLRLVSEIQNVAQRMVEEGKTQEGTLLYYQNKNRLLHYLGRREPVTAHVVRIADREAECLLMGTDGAFGSLTQKKIEEILNICGEPQKIIKTLFEHARETGEEDNQTALFYVADRTEEKAKARLEKDSGWDRTIYEQVFQDAAIPFGSYMKIQDDKAQSFRERFLKKHRMGGKEK